MSPRVSTSQSQEQLSSLYEVSEAPDNYDGKIVGSSDNYSFSLNGEVLRKPNSYDTTRSESSSTSIHIAQGLIFLWILIWILFLIHMIWGPVIKCHVLHHPHPVYELNMSTTRSIYRLILMTSCWQYGFSCKYGTEQWFVILISKPRRFLSGCSNALLRLVGGSNWFDWLIACWLFDVLYDMIVLICFDVHVLFDITLYFFWWHSVM